MTAVGILIIEINVFPVGWANLKTLYLVRTVEPPLMTKVINYFFLIPNAYIIIICLFGIL